MKAQRPYVPKDRIGDQKCHVLCFLMFLSVSLCPRIAGRACPAAVQGAFGSSTHSSVRAPVAQCWLQRTTDFI